MFRNLYWVNSRSRRCKIISILFRPTFYDQPASIRVNEILYGNILSTIYTLYLASEINVNLLTILLFNAPINKLFSAIMQQFVIFVISITHNATKYCSNIASRSERYTIIVGWKLFENIAVFFSKTIKMLWEVILSLLVKRKKMMLW